MYALTEVDGEYDWFQLTGLMEPVEQDQQIILGEYTINLGNGLSLTADQDEGSFTLEASVLPAAPSTDGSYMLKCTVTSGVPTYTWEAVTVGGSY